MECINKCKRKNSLFEQQCNSERIQAGNRALILSRIQKEQTRAHREWQA